VAFNIISFLILTLVTLGLTHGRYASPSFVFGSFINTTGWSSNGWVWFIGLLQSAVLLNGYDSVMHMTEEMERPTIDVPRAMVYANLMGGTIAWILLVIVFFCVQNIQSVINTSTGMPITQIIWDATQSRSVAIGLTCLPFLGFVSQCLLC
jgi:choline transport protein